ncbi:preprotein translocase subunit SecG [Candidatus Roizmanbacteria bacterium RIFCSPHIGHO2_02_FULL_37_15]|uniref:Protein-export membrane protein SecG n=1 Tax=Candidatus Roizmanbacteria bacterium RIFCSPLOWO2_01_FULL_37_16 TaxID=1802058 RepID=A0A1F7IKN6_9BACT|nr:MAG: preprotein translocase subunit SecG [Candidatus Roizmanbacteria bacterium RIFCSPHIGHO2_01_FULL_37_16b]OGK21994.1 MAG: preprotein translocase subunit SecG [Candidatus Roizmanbacteria bacterium RIFCSPHIGHO2_02_FULL_37_15]OGK31755.1 MAG: preprotein translocase subunit SecG [Candidatus Roizmanbacteria bacterium RIFCSPHIGHO2_12_FULL_36_11]OGK43915.1 MAG: preprotein translocase subunit SecG [Candidatus Roizmanbacteria bacterium RIFCSPLOWO2_01_FULL_37_16]OGK56354.1 MAG: preprotein translocase 
MRNILLLVNIALSILVVILILIQGRGAGLGSAWGGGGELFQTRRGIEKLTLRLTVFLIIIFFVISLINLFVK